VVSNLLVCRPLSLYEVVDAELAGTPIKAVSLESWFASKLADRGGLGHCEAREGCGKGG